MNGDSEGEYIMTKTLYYYNAFVTYNDQVTNIHLGEVLDNIRAVDVERRLKHLKQGTMCLMHMKDPSDNLDANDRKVVIGKYRTDKPYLSTLGTSRIDEIPDDVVELTSVFYQRNSRLLIVEYNHYGARPPALQYYLDEFMPTTDNEVWGVILEPIEPDLGFTDVSQSNDIKSISFKIDLTATDREIYHRQNLEDNHQSVLGNVLTQSIETHQEFGANFATVGFANGTKWRQNIMDPEQLVSVLRTLNLESDVFESIKVVYVSPTTGRKETLDLKNQGVLKEVIGMDHDGWEFVCDSMESFFYNRGRIGQNNHRRYTIETNVDLPNLIYNDWE